MLEIIGLGILIFGVAILSELTSGYPDKWVNDFHKKLTDSDKKH